MPLIRRARFAVVLTTDYPGLLAAGQGTMIAHRDYVALFQGREAIGLALPWQRERHWNHFWSKYLGGPKAARRASADAAWERVVPLCLLDSPISGADGATATADVYVYPSAISVIVRVDVVGMWEVGALGAELQRLRRSADWSPPGGRRGTIDAVARGLRDAACALLADTAPEAGSETTLTVAAPIQGEGAKDDLALSNKSVAACLVGLAALGPPGTLRDPDPHLMSENSHTTRKARSYVLRDGHAFWNEEYILDDPDGLVCLHQNQTDLVAHISALDKMITWAAEECDANRQIRTECHELLRNAALRLDQLHAGDEAKTYRSEIAKVRVAPLLDRIHRVQAVL